jgi:hypothetical protein
MGLFVFTLAGEPSPGGGDRVGTLGEQCHSGKQFMAHTMEYMLAGHITAGPRQAARSLNWPTVGQAGPWSLLVDESLKE